MRSPTGVPEADAGRHPAAHGQEYPCPCFRRTGRLPRRPDGGTPASFQSFSLTGLTRRRVHKNRASGERGRPGLKRDRGRCGRVGGPGPAGQSEQCLFAETREEGRGLDRRFPPAVPATANADSNRPTDETRDGDVGGPAPV